jgi:hypothetical protein
MNSTIKTHIPQQSVNTNAVVESPHKSIFAFKSTHAPSVSSNPRYTEDL